MGIHTGGMVLAKANKQKPRRHEVVVGIGGSGRVVGSISPSISSKYIA